MQHIEYLIIHIYANLHIYISDVTNKIHNQYMKIYHAIHPEKMLLLYYLFLLRYREKGKII